MKTAGQSHWEVNKKIKIEKKRPGNKNPAGSIVINFMVGSKA